MKITYLLVLYILTLIISVITVFFVLDFSGYKIIHESDIPPEPIATVIYSNPTDEQLAKWWATSNDMFEVRKRLCSNNYSKNK